MKVFAGIFGSGPVFRYDGHFAILDPPLPLEGVRPVLSARIDAP